MYYSLRRDVWLAPVVFAHAMHRQVVVAMFPDA